MREDFAPPRSMAAIKVTPVLLRVSAAIKLLNAPSLSSSDDSFYSKARSASAAMKPNAAQLLLATSASRCSVALSCWPV